MAEKRVQIRATYQGKDGDLGYVSGRMYTLQIVTRPSHIFEDKRLVIHAERTDGTGGVEYEHFETGFLDNWTHVRRA